MSEPIRRLVALTATNVLLLTACTGTPSVPTASDTPAPVCELSEADIQASKPIPLTSAEFRRFGEWSASKGHELPGDHAYRIPDADPTSPAGSLAVLVITEGCVEVVVHPFDRDELEAILKGRKGDTEI